MSENYSVQDLFKAGLTREQFLAKYNELKTDGKTNSSIFGANMGELMGQVFDTINTDGNDTIDENEINELMTYFDDGDDNSVVSENDMKVLYNKISDDIKSKYESTDAKEMYSQAMKKDSSPSNTYIEDLGQQIEILNELIASRRANSTNIINAFQAKIDDLILKKEELTTEFKKEYKETSDKYKKAKKAYDEVNAKMQAKSQEIESTKAEIAIINQEISGLDPDNDKDEIASKKEEIRNLEEKKKTLSNDCKSLKPEYNSCHNQFYAASGNLTKLNSKAWRSRKDEKFGVEINTYKAKISAEDMSADRDIKNYKEQIRALQKARNYAISQLKSSSNTMGSVDTSSFHTNDNLMSFDELSEDGLKYSSENGQKLAQQVSSKVVGFTGYCSRYVANALSATGLGNERTASACQMDDALRGNKNFKEVKITSQDQLKNLPAGCVVVYEAGAAGYNSKYGHIEVTLGNGSAASDGITRNMRYSNNMSVFVPVENA